LLNNKALTLFPWSYLLKNSHDQWAIIHPLIEDLPHCRNPTLKDCEDDTHTPKMGTWESSETLKNSELNCRG
jgi:hypothetical protein